MSIEIVNGYVCRDCTDVARAKKGEDPAKPDGDAGRSGPTGPASGMAANEPLGINRPLASGSRGTVLNVLL